jgi:MoaA/NifB/PqqE/SkfB family radical SAM enzyme
VRPGSSFGAATSAIKRLVARGVAPQFVFVPSRFNLHEIVQAYDLASSLGCSALGGGLPVLAGRRMGGAFHQK